MQGPQPTSTPTPGDRDLLFIRTPALWAAWPFLPLVRRTGRQEPECGLLYDLAGRSGRGGQAITVWLCNLFLLPQGEEQFLALPHETHDTPEGVVAAGLHVD